MTMDSVARSLSSFSKGAKRVGRALLPKRRTSRVAPFADKQSSDCWLAVSGPCPSKPAGPLASDCSRSAGLTSNTTAAWSCCSTLECVTTCDERILSKLEGPCIPEKWDSEMDDLFSSEQESRVFSSDVETCKQQSVMMLDSPMVTESSCQCDDDDVDSLLYTVSASNSEATVSKQDSLATYSIAQSVVKSASTKSYKTVVTQDMATQTDLQSEHKSFYCTECARPPTVPKPTDGMWHLKSPCTFVAGAWLFKLTISGLEAVDGVGVLHNLERRGDVLVLKNLYKLRAQGGGLTITGMDGKKELRLEYERVTERAEDEERPSEKLQTTRASKAIVNTKKMADSSTMTDIGGSDIVPCGCAGGSQGSLCLLDGIWRLEDDPEQVIKGTKGTKASMDKDKKIGKFQVLRISGTTVVDGCGERHHMFFNKKGILSLEEGMSVLLGSKSMLAIQRDEDGATVCFTRRGDLRPAVP